MTKKDYELIADSIFHTIDTVLGYQYLNEHDKKERKIMAEHVISDLATSLKLENKRFNFDRFYNACLNGQD